MASVASAAIIEGSLIIGLDDGSIINCGFVQGPQGLKGDPGPMGATGDPGLDGNTIHTVAGTPRNDMGRDGDYAIDNINWRIYGPKSGGVWGKAKEMLPGPENIIENGRNTGAATGGGGAGGGSGDGGPVFTNTVIATGAGRLTPSGTGTTSIVNYPGSPLGMISPESGMGVQSNINAFFVKALEELEVNIPVVIDEDRPQVGVYQGMLWFDTSEEDYTLYIYDGVQWVPAAPPVSLEGIEQSIYHISEKLSVVETGIAGARVDIAGNAGEIEAAKTRLDGLDAGQAEQDTKIEALETSQAVQDNQIIELEEEIESLAPSLDRGKWNLAQLGEGVTLASGEYAMGIGANRVYCEEQYAQCLAAIDGNPSENPEASGECNRIASACFNAVDNGTEYFMNDWSHATLLHFHKTDSEGKNHTFADYKVGMFIDLFDQGDTGFAVFEITAAATLDGDVYTIGVHPVQHEGEAAGLARVKVFELAGADPTEFVRNTGDTMTGTLYIRPPKDSAGLRIYAPQGDAGAGQADATQLVRVANSHNQYVFYVEESGAIAGKDGMLPTLNRHLVSKKYVDELIAAELTAPARFEWKVYVNADGTPLQGSANLNGASMSDTSVIRLHKHALNAPVPIKGHGSGLTMYKHSPSPKLYYSTILSAWSKSGAEWQWKGTAEIDEIKLFSDYIQIKLGYRKESNMNFSNTGYYRFTVGGLF